MFDFLRFSKARNTQVEAAKSFDENAAPLCRGNKLMQQCWDNELNVVVPGGPGVKAVILPRTSDTYCM